MTPRVKFKIRKGEYAFIIGQFTEQDFYIHAFVMFKLSEDDGGLFKGTNKHSDISAQYPLYSPIIITWLFTLNRMLNTGFGRKLVELVSVYTKLVMGHHHLLIVVDIIEK